MSAPKARKAITARGRSVTIDLVAVSRKLQLGTLTLEERRLYKAVFGVEPEELRKDPPRVGGKRYADPS